MSTENPLHHRRIRSFVLREGRMTTGQETARDKYWPLYGLTPAAGMLDLATVFGRDADTVLEIGFGMGHSLAEQARVHPERNYIGIEVHGPGVGALLMAVGQHELTNVRVFQHDGVEVLEQCIPDGSLAMVQLFFPDPWHKKRHHKRRIVQDAFAQLLRRKLKIGGVFHMATDWENYAEHMRDVMNAAQGYRNLSASGDYVPRPESRPVTKFEKRGERLGHGNWDLMFERIA